MKQQTGFTLIELVIVVIILGILAAVAVPKFIDLQTDARSSTLKGVKAALEDAATLAYSQASIDGVQTDNANISMAGATVALKNGYPTADSAGIEQAVDLSSGYWKWSGSNSIFVFISGSSNTATCNVEYRLNINTPGGRPIITTLDTGC